MGYLYLYFVKPSDFISAATDRIAEGEWLIFILKLF